MKSRQRHELPRGSMPRTKRCTYWNVGGSGPRPRSEAPSMKSVSEGAHLRGERGRLSHWDRHCGSARPPSERRFSCTLCHRTWNSREGVMHCQVPQYGSPSHLPVPVQRTSGACATNGNSSSANCPRYTTARLGFGSWLRKSASSYDSAGYDSFMPLYQHSSWPACPVITV